VNDKGYTDIYSSGVTPGTLYYVVVWACNGYDVAVKYATTSTTGDPLPVYQTFSVSDYDENYELEDASKWLGTWNLYGIDGSSTSTLRSYLGKAVITASDTPAAGPDDYGLYDEYVYVSGLFGDVSWLASYGIVGFDDRFEMDVYAGVMYSCNNTLVKDDIFGDCTVYLYSKGQGSYGWDYASNYWSAFIPVMDGYYALVDTQYGDSYNFVGFGLYSGGSGWIAQVSDQLLVDPAKDDSGLAKSTIKKSIDLAKGRIEKCMMKSEELGLTGKAAVRAAIARYMEEFKADNHYITPEGVQGLKPIVSIKRVEANHNISFADRTTAKDNISPSEYNNRKHIK